MSPTARTAWILAILALTSAILSNLLTVLAVAGVLVLSGVDAWVVRSAHQAQRSVSDVMSRGVSSELTVEVAERIDRTKVRQPGTPDLRIETFVTRSGLAGTVTPTRRGHHSLPAVATRVRGPLGLGQWTRTVGTSHPVQVFPDMPAARRIASQVRHNLFRIDGLRVRGSLGLGTAFDSIREYVDGDDVRRVNWLATARMRSPMINQYRIEQDRDVICLIDCGRLMGAPVGDLSRLDAAVDAAAAIGAVADVVGDRVGVVAFDKVVLRDLAPLRRGGDAVATAIFDLEPSRFESNYRLAFERVASSKRAFVLVLTDLLDVAAARPLAGAIPILARKHSVAVASVADPDIAMAITRHPTSREDAARAVVAVDVIEARQSAVDEVRRHGATVIDVERAQLNASCVAAYLAAKSRVRF